MSTRRVWHTPLAVVTAVVVAFVAVALLGCGGASRQVDPLTVLSASSAKMQQIKGFHFVYVVHKPGNAKPGPGLEIARITGGVNSDGNMTAAIDVTENAVPLTLDFVQVGTTQYLKLGQWQKIPIASSPVGQLNLNAGTIQILQRITQAKYVGEESKAGANCYHISGMVAAAEVKAIAGAVDTTNTFPTDIWIGVSDSYVYEVDVHGAATSTESSDTWRSVVLSNHNVFVEIKAPI